MKLKSFRFDGVEQAVSYVETMQVTYGVECDVYTFVNDNKKDLGIIRINSGCKTPFQKILKGDRTIEGFISGKGKLIVVQIDGFKKVYEVEDDQKEPFSVNVNIGEKMQWEADSKSNLVAYEICFPPYEDGRFENM